MYSLKQTKKLTGLIIKENEFGLLLTTHRENSFETDESLLFFKQYLFRYDEASFFGTTYSIHSYSYVNNNNHFVVKGIWIPITELPLLLPIYGTWLDDSSLEVEKDIREFFKLLGSAKERIATKSIFPTKDGSWDYEINLPVNKDDSCPPILLREKEQLYFTSGSYASVEQNRFFHTFLQYTVVKNPYFEQWVEPYLRTLNSQRDKQVKQWIKALKNPIGSYELSEHLYPFCLKSWNGKTELPFQFYLLVREPTNSEDPWVLELFLKEWSTGNLHPVKSIYSGKNPFIQNPIPFIKEYWSHLKDIFPFSSMSLQHGECLLSLEEITDFLLYKSKEIENMGVVVLIPEHLKETNGKPKIQGIIQPVDQSTIPYTNWRSSKISLNFLVNGVAVDEIQFKQWVEEKREMIFINDHWVRWDLASAEQLYMDVENSIYEQEYFDIWRKAFFSETEFTSEKDSPIASETEIEWSLGDDWNGFRDTKMSNLPPKWTSQLRSYQKEGVQWLLKMREFSLGACLADDMGLGKTIQAVAYLEIIKEQEVSPLPFLIICPTSLVSNWVHELQTFAPSLSCYVHEGKPKERREKIHDYYTTVDVIITTYPLAVRDIEDILQYQWQGLILDEAQRIKNVHSKQRKAIKHILANHTVALTGTPVENEPMELWSIMDLLNPGYLKDEAWFQTKFLSQGNSEVGLNQLKQLINPFLLRRTKEQFTAELSLPTKSNCQHLVPLYEEQKILYEAVVNDLLDDYSHLSDMEKRSKVFKAITKLKQICNHPAHFLKEPSLYNMTGRSGKWDACIDILERNWQEGKRTLIFTQYRYMGDLLQQSIQNQWQLQIPFFHGQLTASQRHQLVEDYQRKKTGPFMLISLRAGGFGLNLTSATEVIHYDRWWNPAVENQATDRVHRIGQKDPVTIHTFLSEGTLEEKMDLLIREKLSLQEALLNNSSSPIWKLTDNEIKELFRLRG
ncbi:SNF2 family DNA or RNA helicase [Evansella vedderi]|uniref:SNF2 family DNA or RNA helicase n=1 Tax=Evansella vedderi TaxID=38282 RepID=A0ABU0A6N9_9BACI|nr:DEAD/DEAH box helicase [Evansella vedderi]MDQ0257995.1 SNF2 family DNA or RNA helicase [Evansella vedderi]